MKTQKTFLTLAIGTILIPFVAQAAWWNPLSWFNPSETNTIIETTVSPSDSENEQTVTEDRGAPIETDDESAQPYDKTVSPTSSPNDDSEINALKKEIQELRSAVQSTPTTNNVSTPAQQTNSSSVINEQVLETLNKLEQRVEVLESKTRNQEYEKILARIESLEKRPAAQTQDYSAIIKEIIERVNLLANNAGVIVSTPVGVQYVTSLVCDSGNPDSRGNYSNTLGCKDLADLKY